MTVTFTSGNNAVSVAPLDLISSALIEIGALSPGEDVPANNSAWVLEKLQRLIDQLNARREIIYNVNFSLFNLQANHSPHTIGPTGDFPVSLRPVKIVAASFVLNGGSTNPVDTPINVRDDDWWAANPLKSQTSSICTDLYYSPDSPNGSCYFWPIPNVIAPVRLEMWNGIAQAINYTTKLGFVQGYWDAIVLTLALRIFSGFFPQQQPSPMLVASQREAMRAIIGNNSDAPRIRTDGGGMPSAGRSGPPDFDFLTGLNDN